MNTSFVQCDVVPPGASGCARLCLRLCLRLVVRTYITSGASSHQIEYNKVARWCLSHFLFHGFTHVMFKLRFALFCWSCATFHIGGYC